jgi:GNAT superfamily N-acetyltransferase
MNVRSLGYRTDLIFHRFGYDQFASTITDRDTYLIIRTPHNPTYRWGNFLLFSRPPQPGDLERWEGLFAREVGTPPEVQHRVFGWDTVGGETGDVAPFLAAGYRLEQSVVMTTDTLTKPRKYNREVQIGPLEQSDFAEVIELHVLSRDEEESEAGYRTFWQESARSYERMSAAGLGRWFGAFYEGQLVADMGIFAEGDLARFQAVVTHPEFRRRGICATLLYETGRYALQNLGAKTLVISADEHYFAKNIYASVGFEARERQVGLEWVERAEI